MASSNTHVALAGDRNILPGMAVAGRSALERSSGPLVFEILGTGLTNADKVKLSASWNHVNNAGVNFHDIEQRDIKNYRSTMYLKSKAAYSRYYIGRIPNVDRLVYIDTDIIVLRDIAEAGAMDLEGRTVAAVRDISVRLQPEQSRMTDILGMQQSGDYFNSGFLIIDMNRWRALNAEQTLCDLSVSMFDRLDCQDQDALNIVFEDDLKLLDTSWNTSQYEAKADVNGVILHLIGTVKPWHADYNYHFKDVFSYWLDRTAFGGGRKTPSNGIAARLLKLGRKIPTSDMMVRKARQAFVKMTARFA